MAHPVFTFQKLNEKVSVVMDYESSRALPNQQILGKMERVLGKNGLTTPMQAHSDHLTTFGTNLTFGLCMLAKGQSWLAITDTP